MGNKREIFHLEKYGSLYLDQVLFEAGYPILFVCVDGKQRLFLCICCQNNENGRKWLLSVTSVESILDMLRDKATIRECLLGNTVDRFYIFEKPGESALETDDLRVWQDDSVLLPKRGEYLDADPGEFDDEIRYYEEIQSLMREKKREYKSADSTSFEIKDEELLFNITAFTDEELLNQQALNMGKYLDVLTHIDIELEGASEMMVYDNFPLNNEEADAA